MTTEPLDMDALKRRRIGGMRPSDSLVDALVAEIDRLAEALAAAPDPEWVRRLEADWNRERTGRQRAQVELAAEQAKVRRVLSVIHDEVMTTDQPMPKVWSSHFANALDSARAALAGEGEADQPKPESVRLCCDHDDCDHSVRVQGGDPIGALTGWTFDGRHWYCPLHAGVNR